MAWPILPRPRNATVGLSDEGVVIDCCLGAFYGTSCRGGTIHQPEAVRLVAKQDQRFLAGELADLGFEREAPVLLRPVDRLGVPGEDAGAPLGGRAVVAGPVPEPTLEHHHR